MSDLNAVERTLSKLLQFGVSLETVTELQGRYHELVIGKQAGPILEWLDELQAEHPGVDFRAAKQYVGAFFSKILAKEAQREVMPTTKEMVDGLQASLLPGHKQVRVLHSTENYREMKGHMKRIIEGHYMQNQLEPVPANRFIYPFLISEDFNRAGTLTARLFESPQSIELIRTGLGKQGEPEISFFGELGQSKQPVDTFAVPFYVYQFITDEGESFFVFSQKEIPTQHARVIGMLSDQADKLKIGSTVGTAIAMKCVFASDILPDIVALTPSQFDLVRKDYASHDVLASKILGDFRHPKDFEQLLMAWLLGGKPSGFPLHLGWISQPGGGKSDALEALAKRQFREDIYDGTTGTFRGLVPHFGGHRADAGFFSKSRRICVVDELFSALKRNSNEESMDSETALLTTILEHKERVSASGSHEPIRVNASSRAIFATNPKKYGLNNMVEVAGKLSNAFLSRILWYVMTPQHYDFIQQRKRNFTTANREDAMPKHDKVFVAMVDHLQAFMVKDISPDEIARIYEEYAEHVSIECQDIYAARSHHHIAALIDGVAKYRVLTSSDSEFRAKPEDYELAAKLFGVCILSWTFNSAKDIMKVPERLRENYVTPAQRRAYDAVSGSPGIAAYELEKLGHGSRTLDALFSYELIRQGYNDAGKINYYPHWYKVSGKSNEL